MSETRFWWLRHAPVPGAAGRIHGNLDLPCDISEAEEFAALAARLPRGAALVESGLIRCRQTAGALEAAGLVLPPPIVEPALAEQDFGHWQGLSWGQIGDSEDPEFAAFWRAPAAHPPPGGESFVQVVARVRAAILRLADQHPDRDVIAIAHAGTIRAALCVALDLDPGAALRVVVEPLSLTRLDRTAESWRVVAVNVLPGG